MISIENTIEILEDLKKREKRACYPNEYSFTKLHFDRLEAHDNAIKALSIINRLLKMNGLVPLDFNPERSKGFSDGVKTLLGIIKTFWEEPNNHMWDESSNEVLYTITLPDDESSDKVLYTIIFPEEE